MRSLRFLSLPSILCIFLCASALWAQNAANLPRIAGNVDESALVTLPGNRPWLARAHSDLGAASVSTSLTHIRLVLSRSAAQQAALETFESELLDKSSPNYHKWLKPAEFGKLYGPPDSDIAVIVAWLESHGLTVESVSPGRTNIAFSGTVGQVQEALHTNIHRYQADGEQFTANTSNPRIPAALAAVVSGVARLNTLRPRPHHIAGHMGVYDQSRKTMALVHESMPRHPRAQLTTGSGTSADPYFLNIVPADAAVIYDTPNSTLNPNFSSTGTSYTGKGVTIGIGGDATILPATVADYRSRFLGDTVQPVITNVDGVTSTLDTNEAYIDTELSGGLAPSATIHFYTSTDLVSGIERAINDNVIDIFSLSFGVCELGMTTADNALTNSWWQQAAAQGIAVTVSTGDDGSAGCDDNNTETAAKYGLAVNGFASTPYNIAVGGTDLDGLIATSSSFATYVNTTNDSKTYRSAKSYIPESSWNDSPITDGALADNVPYIQAAASNIVAGSGGASTCSTNTDTANTVGSCTSGYPRPAWQRGAGVSAANTRSVPDVSLASGDGADLAAWAVCTDDTSVVSSTLKVTGNCTTQSDGNFYFSGYGGTSTATPAFAGILALVQEKTGSRLGQAAKELYDLYNGSNATAIFHDVTLGNNSVVCTSGPPACANNSAGYDVMTGFDATIGYDEATGLGSVDAAQLVANWGTGSSAAAASVTVSPSVSTLTTLDPLTVTVAVAPSGGQPTPTGSITLTAPGYASAIQMLSAGSATFSIAAGALTAGPDTLTAIYNGEASDSNYAVSSGTATITVNKASATATIVPGNTSFFASVTLTVTGTVTGTGPTPAGTVTLSGGGYSSPAVTLSGGAYTVTIPANSLAAGSDILTATYSGDDIYKSSTATASVSVLTPLTPVVSVTPAAATVAINQSLSVTVAITGTGATPTGTVTLSGGGFNSGAKAVSAGSVVITIPAGSLAVGTDALTAAYSGDSAYSPASGAASVIVSLLTPTVSVTPASTNPDAGQTLSVAVAVAGSGTTPSGTVTLSSGGYTSMAQTLANGAFTFTIPASTLSTGTDTLTASYSGDSLYSLASGTATVTVAPSVYTLAATVPAAISAGGTATSTVTIATKTAYSGTVTLACALTSSPSGAMDLPSCTVSGSGVTLSSSATSATSTVSVATTKAAALEKPRMGGWANAGGGALLALLVFMGITARRCAWRSLVGALGVMAVFVCLSACGSSGSSNPGTNSGVYTFTVTGTGSPAVTPAPSTTFIVTIN